MTLFQKASKLLHHRRDSKHPCFKFYHSGGCHIAYPNSVCMQLEKTSTYPCDANTDVVELLQHAGKVIVKINDNLSNKRLFKLQKYHNITTSRKIKTSLTHKFVGYLATPLKFTKYRKNIEGTSNWF